MKSSVFPQVRPLYIWEIQEAWRVFGSSLDYEHVRVHEGVRWTYMADRIGSWMKRTPYSGAPKALTLGYHCYFPLNLPATPVAIAHPDHYKMSWLIHELTHIWQFQRLGWRYMVIALQAQLRQGEKAYDFGDEIGLSERYREGWKLADFNLEQQGDITRTYYERLCQGQDVSAWLPYIKEIQPV